jgi:Flp pilus assembly protein TadD
MASPDDRETLERIRELLARGEGPKAHALCRREFAGREPTTAEALVTAEALFACGHLRRAEDALRDLIRKGGLKPAAAVGLADILGRTGRSDEAVVLLREQEQLRPGEAAPPLALGIILSRMAQQEGEPAARLARCAQAEEAYRRALEIGGWQEAIARGLAALEVLRRRPGRALALLEEALESLVEPAPRQGVLADLLLYQVMWGEKAAAEETARRLGREADREPEAFAPVLLELAGQARRMAGGEETWRTKALFFADILEGLQRE